MNRRKKVIKKLTKKAKQAHDKKKPKNKNPYLSKAERAALENSTDNNHDEVEASSSEE